MLCGASAYNQKFYINENFKNLPDEIKNQPPFMAACAEVEVDPETGAIELLDYTACVDCGRQNWFRIARSVASQ